MTKGRRPILHGLEISRKQPPGFERPRNRGEHGLEIAGIGQDIGREDEVVAGRVIVQIGQGLRLDERVIEPALGGFSQHAARQVDARHRAAESREMLHGKARSAAKVQYVVEVVAMVRHQALQALRNAIAEEIDELLIELGREAIEVALQIVEGGAGVRRAGERVEKVALDGVARVIR